MFTVVVRVRVVPIENCFSSSSAYYIISLFIRIDSQIAFRWFFFASCLLRVICLSNAAVFVTDAFPNIDPDSTPSIVLLILIDDFDLCGYLNSPNHCPLFVHYSFGFELKWNWFASGRFAHSPVCYLFVLYSFRALQNTIFSSVRDFFLHSFSYATIVFSCWLFLVRAGQ